MHKELSFQERLLKSLFDMKFYRQVLKEKTSKAVLYGLLIALFFGSLSMIRPVVMWNNAYGEMIKEVTTSMPEFTIKDHHLQYSGEKPYTYSHLGISISVNPKESTPEVDKDSQYGYFISNTNMVTVLNYNNSKLVMPIFDYNILADDEFNKKTFIQMLYLTKHASWAQLVIVAIPSILLLAISVLVTMLFGAIAYAGARKKISFRDNMVIALYANTLIGLMILISFVFYIEIPFGYPMCMILISLIYFYLSRVEEA